MAIRLPRVIHAKAMLWRSNLFVKQAGSASSLDVPKGFLAVYVGEIEKKRFVIPLSYLNHPSFQELLCKVAEEFDFQHPMGGLTIPCAEDIFVDITSHLNRF